jgi:hypothetical protein
MEKALIPGGQISADHTDGVQFVDPLRDSEECRHGSERLTPKVHVGAGHDDPDPPVRESVGHVNDAGVQKLGLIDGDHLGRGAGELGDLGRVGNGYCVDLVPVV